MNAWLGLGAVRIHAGAHAGGAVKHVCTRLNLLGLTVTCCDSTLSCKRDHDTCSPGFSED